MRHGLMDQVINDLKAAVWTVIVTKRTRSLSYYRLSRLSKRTPRRIPGTFRFPFGRIRYIDAFSLLFMYSGTTTGNREHGSFERRSERQSRFSAVVPLTGTATVNRGMGGGSGGGPHVAG